MRRREFIAGVTGTVAWPLAARAQQPKVPVVGLLNGVSFEGAYAAAVAALRQGLQDTGFVEGQNLAIEYRTADGQYERLPDLANDLVRRQVAVIIAIGASAPALATQAATATVPIGFAMGSDAVEVGVADSLNRPQANLTGANATAAELASRRLELLLELRPGAPLLGYLALQRVRALVVGPDPFLRTRQEQIVALAAQSALPTIYAARGAVVLGGLMSYGVLANDMYRLAGIYAGQILKGEIPAESPVMLPTRFELVINNRTARTLRITVPRRMLARADEIIE